MTELTAAQKTFGIDHPTCEWTGEPIQVGSGSKSLWEQAHLNLNSMQWRFNELEARIAPETIALSRLQRDFKAPPPSPPGFVYLHAGEADLRKQEELLASLVKERHELAERIKTARTKMKLDTRVPSFQERLVFGVNCRAHPVTGMILEDGVGRLSDDQQALAQCDLIEEKHGKAVADVMRKKVADYAAMKAEEAKLAAAQAKVEKDGIEISS